MNIDTFITGQHVVEEEYANEFSQVAREREEYESL